MCFISPIFRPASAGLFLAALLTFAGCGKTPPPSAEKASATNNQPSAASAPASNMVSNVTVTGNEQLPPNHPPLPSGVPPHPANVAGNPSDLNQQLASLHPAQTGKKKLDVVVPGNVKGKWASVTLAVTHDGAEKELKLAIGDTVSLGENLQLHLVHFLPAYNSGEQTVTSSSSKPINPAVLIQSISNGQIASEGWVFQKFPEFNSFSSNQIKVRLVSAERIKK